MNASIAGIEYYLPQGALTNDMLAAEFPEWSVDKIREKTGINKRHIAASNECSSDLGVKASRELFRSGICNPADVDFVLFCTQSPDYFLPSSACLIQSQLGIPTTAGALDFNLGCSGYVYGLGLAKGLVETGQASTLLLITAETYSKFVHCRDKSVRTIFGDAGAATLVKAVESDYEHIGPFVYGTDGRGAQNLIVPVGGLRRRYAGNDQGEVEDVDGNFRTASDLYMNGAEIFGFTLKAVPNAVQALLARSGRALEDIDVFIFHQANRYMLEHLRKKLRIPPEKFFVSMDDCGNTVSCTIPIALKRAQAHGTLRSGALVMLVGFGVGYSWGATLVTWE